MKESVTTYFEGHLIEEHAELTLVELCRASGASAEQLTLWVYEGAFEPRGAEPQEWRFSGAELRRAATAQRLARDLEINAAGIALVLDLLDQIEGLRGRGRH
jgi:chaperone modulatory protein CbpM